MADREFDVVVWGATGFTGALVVEYLAATYGVSGDLNWAVAGRNETKLDAVCSEYLGADAGKLPKILADSGDPASLAAMAARTTVVCTTVGPYALYGTPLVEACVDAGTHYCDLTGEVQWMADVIPQYQERASASGARILHTCGFDSVPFDMGVWFVQEQMQARHGVYADEVKGRVSGSRGGASGGTIASMMVMMEEARKDPSLMQRMADPYVLCPPDARNGPDGPDQRGPVYDEDFEQWTSPFVMAAINTRVVRRSNALLGHPWGDNFRYSESVLNTSRGQARMLGLATGAGMLTLALGPLRAVAKRFLPKPGEGPSKETRENGYYEVFFLGIDHTDRSHDTKVKVRGELDPGYGSTSRMLAESAVCLAQDPLTVGGGFWTPASALGEYYLPRLTGPAGLTFEVV
ncbi:MAG: saccharopine dehydrogenase [Halioglobus sp.]|nr:saccharopine dehydrogenase [Halioglobus sp.]